MFRKLMSERTARRLARKPAQQFHKLSPSELEKLGLSPKAERYAETGAKRITRKTPTISKRQFLTKQRGGVTLEKRAEEYRSGERTYANPAQRAAASGRREKAALKRRIKALDVIENMNPHRLAADGTRPTYKIGNETKTSFFVNRQRKLKGEWIDEGDWHEMMDIANAANDPDIETLYQSNEELV